MFRNLTTLPQIVSMNVIVSGVAVLGISWAASAQSITPQTQPDCAKVVCTTDGAELAKPKVTVTITPQATIKQVCRPTSCFSSWIPHKTDKDAIGNEPQFFEIPKEDQR